jgi:hypothetical protein
MWRNNTVALRSASYRGIPHRKGRVCNLELMKRTRNQTAGLSVERPFLSTSEEKEASHSNIRNMLVGLFLIARVLFIRKCFSCPDGLRRYYYEVLQRLSEQVCRQHQNDCGTRTNWFTVTVRRCTLLVSLQQQFLAAEIIAAYHHPSFWFKFAPCDLFFFTRMKS